MRNCLQHGKSFAALFLAVTLSLSSTPLFAQDYQVSGNGAIGFTSISTTGANITPMFGGGNFGVLDDGFQDLTIPFAFEFFGTAFPANSTVRLFADGYMQFNSVETTSVVSLSGIGDLSSAGTPDEAIFFAFQDLDLSIFGSVFQETRMGANGMEFVVEFQAASEFNFAATAQGSYDVQVILHETSNEIEILYGTTFLNTIDYGAGGLRSAAGATIAAFPNSALQSAVPAMNVLFEPAMGTADLLATNLTVSRSTLLAGESVDLAVGIENIGQVNSPAFDLGVYLSLDATIDSNDQLITTVSGLQLDVGVNSPQTLQVIVPVPNPVSMIGRSYFIGVLADNAGVVTELNTANNGASVAVRVGPDPYLVLAQAQTSFSSIIGQAGTTEIASSAVNPADDGEVGITTPANFSFDFFGVNVPAGTDVAVGYNGYIEIGDATPATGSNFSNTALPTSNTSTTSPNDNVIALFWDDLNVSATGTATIAQQVTGAPGSQVWIIEFNQLSRTGVATPGYTGQIVIEEGTNTISLNYDPSLDFAGTASATIGIEGVDDLEFIELSTQTGSPSANARPATNFMFLENQNVNNTVDLGANSVVASTSNAFAASSISANFDLVNTGSTDSGAFDYAIVLSTDNRFDMNDQIVTTDSVSNIASMGSMSLSFPVPLPQTTAPGTYFVGVIANVSAVPIVEFDYFNNSSFSMAIQVDPAGVDQGDLNDDDAVNVADIVFSVNIAIGSSANNLVADLNNDGVVNVQDVQILIVRVINAP